MKIGGIEKLELNRGVAHLIRGDVELPLLVTALPAGWRNRIQSVGLASFPSAPKKVLKDGERVVKGPNGRVEVIDDLDDPTYVARTKLVVNRITAVNFAEVLREDTTVEFMATKPTNNQKEDWEAYADALVGEIQESGLTDNEVEQILAFAASLGSSVDIGKAADAF